MKRLALGLAWVAAGFAGVELSAPLYEHAPPPVPWFLYDAVYFAPLAALLAVLVRDRVWSILVVLDLGVLAVAEHFLRLPLNAILQPLAPVPSSLPLARIDYLPVQLAGAILYGLLVSGIELAVLWPFLKPAWMWPVFRVIGGGFGVFAGFWQLYVPVPGTRGALWDPISGAVALIAIALLWRFDAQAPRWRPPKLQLPAEVPIDSAYGDWMADLERSLEVPPP